MTKLLVIGSNSFSGASFCKFALLQGARVIGISRSEEPVDALLPYKWVEHKLFEFHRLDLNHDLNAIIDLIKKEKIEYVVNFAAQSMVAESWLNPEHWYMTNTVSTVKLHDELRKLDFLKHYVHISTPEVYGSCSGFVKENFPFNPSTPYAVSRAAADMSLHAFFQAYQFPVVTTRASNVYGPGQQLYRIIPRAILFILIGKKIQLHGGGYSTRSFIHIKDVSDATWKIMLGGKNGESYHISTSEIISIRDLVDKICQKLERNFDECVEVVGERLGKDLAYHLDSSKVRKELIWQDAINLDQGLDECIEWVKENYDVLTTGPYNYKHKP
jgi:dTDP-glucose 4,6-dehydratase